jgi:protein TonB
MQIPGNLLGILVAAIFVGVIALIVIMRNVYKKRSQDAMSGAFEGQNADLKNRNKYQKVNVFGLSGTFLNLGLVLSLGLAVLAFAWTQFEEQVIIPEGALELEEDIEIEPPRTAEPPPPPPPPPPPVIEEVPEEELIDEEPPEFTDQSIDEDVAVEAPEPVKNEAPPPPPPPPPPPAPKVEEIFKVVEEMPRFPGCEDLGSAAERKQCADKKMLEFIYKNIKYPAIARENGIEGTAVVTFVVEKDGSVTDARLLRDPKGGTGEEALRVVNLMNTEGIKWIPGKQRGRPVRVQFNLPVKFKLE